MSVKITALRCVFPVIPRRTPEIETADLSQSGASLNLSQFRAYCLFHRNSSRVTENNYNMRLMLEINYKDS